MAVNFGPRQRTIMNLALLLGDEAFLSGTRPGLVVIAAAKVGGIRAKSLYPAEFIAKNLAIARDTIQATYKAGVLFSNPTASTQKLPVGR